MPEEKAAAPTTTPTTEYKRVYPDWKPSTALEKTDVVGNIEAIEDAQTARSKDKSAWRKSNLNVPSTTEDIEYSNRSSRKRDTYIPNSSSAQLQSIVEEDRRKNVRETGEKYSPNETSKGLIRRPSDAHEYEPVYQKYDNHRNPVTITSDQHSIYIRPSTSSHKSPTSPEVSIAALTLPKNIHHVDEQPCNKIEIDSDNIETPPAIRRNITSDSKATGNPSKKLQMPRPLHRKTAEDNELNVKEIEADAKLTNKLTENEVLGDGQFDRYSSARRTRRYRRPTDHSSGHEERSDTSPDLPSPSEPIYPISRSQNNSSQFDKRNSKETHGTTISTSELQSPKVPSKDDVHSSTIISRVGKMGRNISAINQEDVREAIRNLKSPTETPDRIWSPPREIVVKEKPTPLKAVNHELNDEGFEETQSLVSDTPSHGKDSTSSCNDQADKSDNRVKVSRMTSSESTATAASSEVPTTKRRPVSKTAVQSLLERNRQSLERSRSLRTSGPSMIRNIIPKRTNSLRRSELHTVSPNKKDVERSNSRTSLRSSRSSLNSSASTNTVRNMGLKTSNIPSQVEKPIYKKPLNVNSSSNSTVAKTPSKQNSSSRTPASRSSSSGSSVGPTIRRTQNKTITSPTSNSGSLHSSTTASPQRPAFRSAVSSSTLSSLPAPTVSVRTSPSARLSNLTKGIASKSARVSNFMRPTTASATKGKGK